MNREIARYIVAGGLAFLADFGVLWFCTAILGMHYLLSALFGYACGLAVSYALNTQWVFEYRRYEKTWLEFLIFNLIVLAGLVMNEALMATLVGGAGLHYLWAKVITTSFITLFNYFTKKFILFHPVSSGKQAANE